VSTADKNAVVEAVSGAPERTPARTAAPSKRARAPQPGRCGGHAHRQPPLILVVDDDNGVRELAGTILRNAGYRVLEAETGQRAILLFEANRDIDLIFTDIVMPGLDGFKLADITKFRRPEIRVVYATAFMELAGEKLGVIHGQILQKPYLPSQLEQVVKETLR